MPCHRSRQRTMGMPGFSLTASIGTNTTTGIRTGIRTHVLMGARGNIVPANMMGASTAATNTEAAITGAGMATGAAINCPGLKTCSTDRGEGKRKNGWDPSSFETACGLREEGGEGEMTFGLLRMRGAQLLPLHHGERVGVRGGCQKRKKTNSSHRLRLDPGPRLPIPPRS